MFGKLFKSKTIMFNALLLSAFDILKAVGVDLPADVVVNMIGVGNFILRLCTTKAIKDK